MNVDPSDRKLLETVLLQMIKLRGFDKTKNSCNSVLLGITERYISRIAEFTVQNCETDGRDIPTVYDILGAFEILDIDINTLFSKKSYFKDQFIYPFVPDYNQNLISSVDIYSDLLKNNPDLLNCPNSSPIEDDYNVNNKNTDKTGIFNNENHIDQVHNIDKIESSQSELLLTLNNEGDDANSTNNYSDSISNVNTELTKNIKIDTNHNECDKLLNDQANATHLSNFSIVNDSTDGNNLLQKTNSQFTNKTEYDIFINEDATAEWSTTQSKISQEKNENNIHSNPFEPLLPLKLTLNLKNFNDLVDSIDEYSATPPSSIDNMQRLIFNITKDQIEDIQNGYLSITRDEDSRNNLDTVNSSHENSILETSMTSRLLICPVCNINTNPYLSNQDLIRCVDCNEWYHLACLKIDHHGAELIKFWSCFKCVDKNPKYTLRSTTGTRKRRVLFDP